MLAGRSDQDLIALFHRTNLWYLKYLFQYLTAPIRRQPTFFLLGFPKCGTTYLASMLRSLQDVDGPTALAPGAKETVHYRRDQKLHWFMPIRGFYPVFSTARHIMDASVSYALDPGALELAAAHHPGARAVLVVRDQVSAIQSGINYYNHGLWRSNQDAMQKFNDPDSYRQFPLQKAYAIVEYCMRNRCSIVVALRAEPVLRVLGDQSDMAQRIAAVLYDMWLQPVYTHFGRANIRVIRFSDLVEDPVNTWKQAADFLGIKAADHEFQLENKTLKKHVSERVFELNEPSRQAIREMFFAHNEALHHLAGVDLNA